MTDSATPSRGRVPPHRPERSRARRLVRLVAGTGLVLIGILGLVLPVLPGWIFIVPGLSLLSTEFRWAADLRRMASRRLDRMRGNDPDDQDARDREDGAPSRDDEPGGGRRTA